MNKSEETTLQERYKLGEKAEARVAEILRAKGFEVYHGKRGTQAPDLLARDPVKNLIWGIDVKWRRARLEDQKTSWPGHMLKKCQTLRLIEWGKETGHLVAIMAGYDCGALMACRELEAFEPTESRNPWQPKLELVSMPWGLWHPVKT